MNTRIVLAAVIVLSAAAVRAGHEPPKGSLLDGLTTPSSAGMAGPTPAEVKINEGAAKLKIGMEVATGKKDTRHFKEAEGYLQLMSGDRLDGFFTLHALSLGGAPFKLSRVEFRETATGAKRDPTTMSASPRSRGASSFDSSCGSCWPSPSSRTASS